MIFVTIGEQLPFDRLIRAVDQWAAKTNRQVFAQIGRSTYRPCYIEYKDFLAQSEFKQKLQEANLIVAHAGIGTIISALELGKPIIVMPRRSAMGEHRNDHQLATSKRFFSLHHIKVALDENELLQKLDSMEKDLNNPEVKKDIAPSSLLMQTIRDFLAIS